MSIKVVIVDDHQLFIDGIVAILRTDLSIEVVGQAHNGFELLKYLESNPAPDIIMMDIRMPIMDGIMTSRIVTKEYPKIAILALSMYTQEEDVQEMMNAGAKGYLVKNAGKKEMLEALYSLNNKKQFYSLEIREKMKNGTLIKSDIKKLTRREKEILDLIAQGRTSLQIADTLSISKMTVDTHRKNIHKKLGTTTNAGLIKYALQVK